MIEENSSRSSFLIVGLGNPGRQFRKDRHNIGFMALDRIANSLELQFSKTQHSALITDGILFDQKTFFAKPVTYMNNVGRSVAPLMRYFRIPIEQLLVVYDDLDLPLGTIRMRPQGGSGGHRGMRSIIRELGEEHFPRMRLGIGRPPGQMDPANYVLQKFSEDEIELLDIVLSQSVDAVQMFIREGIELTMTRYNTQNENS